MSISTMVRTAAFSCSVFFCGNAFAQVGRPPVNPYSRPVTSPYLNLLDRNNSIEFNYFQRVRPQQEFQRADAQQRQAIRNLQREVNEQRDRVQAESSTLGPTGHSATFLNYGNYFPLAGSRGGGQLGPRAR